MEKAELRPPVFENVRGVFNVTLYNEKETESGGNGNGAHITEKLLCALHRFYKLHCTLMNFLLLFLEWNIFSD